MSPGKGYPIEEFLEAITAQLDQTQDALRLKAVNRPLTFALKDFNVDLKVFVEMDSTGRVTFRPAAPMEEGASTVSIGFTTITRPMIEENTISMEMAQAPTLEELGLERQEQRQLAKIGVRNAAQLRNLERKAGDSTMSRHTGVNIDRIKSALQMSRPTLDAAIEEPPVQHADPGPVDFPTPQPVETPGGLVDRLRGNLAPDKPVVTPVEPKKPGRAGRKLRLAQGARDVKLTGRNLIDGGQPPRARLDGRPVDLLEADMNTVRFALPDGFKAGHLNVELPDGTHQAIDIECDTPGGLA